MTKRYSSGEGSAEGHFVGVLQFIVLCDASGYDCHFDACLFEFAEDEVVGGVALHRGTEGKDDFLHPTPLDALHEALYLQIARTNAVHRTDDTAKHVIESAVLHRVLDSHHILNILDHTDLAGITIRIAANLAPLIIADIVADFTVAHTFPHVHKTLGQRFYPLLILPEQVKSQAKSRLAANARLAVDFHYGFLEKL